MNIFPERLSCVLLVALAIWVIIYSTIRLAVRHEINRAETRFREERDTHPGPPEG